MQGKAFMGRFAAPPREWLHAGRDRMDERVDMARAIRDGRYLYICNFRPDRVQGEYLAYMFETPTTQVWKALHDAKRLDAVQDAFWQEKAPEELYDLDADPDAVRNLAADPAHAATRMRLRKALVAHMEATRDLGVLPEVDMHRRRGQRAPYDLAMDAAVFPVRRILDAALRAAARDAAHAPALRGGLRDADPAVRYWSALGLRLLGSAHVRGAAAGLQSLLSDGEPGPCIAAADALARFGRVEHRALALDALVGLADYRRAGNHAAILALDTIVALGDRAAPIRARAAAVPSPGKDVPTREQEYVVRLKKALQAR
jgi:uncharacterized sulfatase